MADFKIEIDTTELGEIRSIYELGLSEEQLKLCKDEKLTDIEINLIAKCLDDGVPYERMQKYIKHEFSINWLYYVDEDEDSISYSAIEYIVKGIRLGFTDEQIALYTTSGLRWWQMGMVINGIKEGFTPEQIATYAHSCYSYNEMLERYNKVKNG